MAKKTSVIVDFSIVPVGTGKTSIGAYIAAAVKAIEECNLRYEITPMGTIMEAKNLSEIFHAVKKAHEAVVSSGATRVVSTLKIDDRRDKARTKESKVDRIKEELKKSKRR